MKIPNLVESEFTADLGLDRGTKQICLFGMYNKDMASTNNFALSVLLNIKSFVDDLEFSI